MNDALPTAYALLWRSSATDEEWDQAAFDARIPALMDWLRDLRASGRLAACGGGGFENHMGGLTIVRADTAEEALEIAAAHPMNALGETELLVWDVYFAALDVPRAW